MFDFYGLILYLVFGFLMGVIVVIGVRRSVENEHAGYYESWTSRKYRIIFTVTFLIGTLSAYFG
ncbi:hypothetical protein KQ51_01714 [Candidatus Izimaplasma bacterium HR1]|jgi:uncharacterized membrane protein YfcA|uniref:hypothetical protein n=1 Tax=Candidatus Izimoplasma sp. HR1 TaxID=1541959 RepID=UPI0004F8A772|nr:hypothetical protein KQ51_01714 [Candidatus Izimaplasma bacterium HR1]